MRHKRIPNSGIPSEYKALGRAIRELRRARDLSQEELAYRSRMHRNYLGAIERGTVNPTFDVILRVLYGLNTTIDVLVKSYNRHFKRAISATN
jgi:transcriptional regulator with XRE-family HTH domain